MNPLIILFLLSLLARASLNLTDHRVGVAAELPRLLVVEGGVSVALFFLHDETHVLVGLHARTVLFQNSLVEKKWPQTRSMISELFIEEDFRPLHCSGEKLVSTSNVRITISRRSLASVHTTPSSVTQKTWKAWFFTPRVELLCTYLRRLQKIFEARVEAHSRPGVSEGSLPDRFALTL